jgi:hypothetical protein
MITTTDLANPMFTISLTEPDDAADLHYDADCHQTSNCGTTLAVGASCTIKVTFSPNQTGPYTATLNVNVAAPATPVAVPLTGTGI